MWGIVAVILKLVSDGPEPASEYISKAGMFEDKASCEAKIEETVPDRISAEHRKLYEAGEVVYVCLKAAK